MTHSLEIGKIHAYSRCKQV